MRLFRPRWKKVIRDMTDNKSRTVLVIMAIAVGIFAIGVTAGSRETVERVLNESYLATNPASGTVMAIDEFDDNFVETIDGMRQIEDAEGRAEITLRYKLNPTDEWQQIDIIVADDFEAGEISKVWPEAGEWPPPDKKLVIERASLPVMGAEIGNTVIIQTSDEKEREMEIVGSALNQGGHPAALTSQPSGFISRDTLEWLGEDRNFNRLLFVVAEDKMDKAHIEAVGDLIENKFQNENLGVFRVEVSNPGEHPVNSVLEPLLLILTGLGGLALALSGFLVVNTISAMLAQQTRQIGMMKAIGARRGQIMWLYFVTVFVYGFLALVIALPLGAAGAYALTTYLLDFFNTDLESFSIPTSVLSIQVAIGLLVPLVVAIYPITAGTRITVREAVSDYGVGKGKYGTGLLDRLMGYLRGVSRPMLISLRNTFRRKGRLALTLATLTLAGTTFITIFSVRASMLTTMDELLSSFGFDMIVMFEDEYRMVEIERTTSQMPAIAAVENWGRATVNRIRPDGYESNDITMEAPPADTRLFQPEVLEGRWLQADDTIGVVVNTDLLDDEPDLQLGDQMVLELNSKEYTWQIIGTIQGTMEGATVYVNQPYFFRLTHEVGKARVLRVAIADEYAADTQQLLRPFEEQFEQAGLEVSQIMTISQIQAMMESSFNFLISFLLAMALILAAVGGLGLSGTMSMNVLERVREIGVMRAIGASDGAVLRLVLVEGVIIGLISWVFGAILAVPLSLLISNLLGVSLLNQPLTYTFSLGGMWMWFALALILAALASFFPARSASQLTVREVLAYE